MEGELHPTAQQVADRSGVSLRSVFRHFQSLETLLLAAIDWYLDRHADLFVFTPPPAGASFDERVEALVAYRADLYEASGRQIQAAVALAGSDGAIAARVEAGRAATRSVIATLFEPELTRLRDAEARAAAGAAHAAVSFEAWWMLSSTYGLDAEQIRGWFATAVREAFSHARVN